MLSVPTLWTAYVINFLALGLIWAYVMRCYPSFEAARFWTGSAFVAAAGAAMAMLRAKLLERQERERQAEIAKEKGEAQDVNFGSQIRSYVLHPYTMVKDHRTNVEVGNAQGVLDGDLDEFVRAELLREAATN